MKAFLLILGLLLVFKGSAQNKYDNNWVFGYGPSDPDLHYGGTLIHFEGDPIVTYFETDIGFFADKASISNKEGNLIAYTNGCQVQNRIHEMMENGDAINEGPVQEQYCVGVQGGAYVNDQGALFLPYPGSDSLYALFHLRWWPGGSLVKDLLYTIVDASANDGLGKVIVKNQPLQTDTFTDMVTACRHANGRDWWIVVEENHRFATLPPDSKGKFHFFLFDLYGIHDLGEQQIGRLSSYQSFVGQTSFSPDGTRYATGNIHNGVNFFDFDRCTGTLSNPGHLDLMADSVVAMGLAFSPNSRYLYVTTGLWILQYDMEAADVATSKVNVAQYDGFQSQLPTTFFQLALAPNGKIYGSSHFGTDVLHIIHQPDQPGLACEVEQHGLKLPTYHAFTMPNVPHYRLYDVPGSGCDSLGINGPTIATKEPNTAGNHTLTLFPNPARQLISLYLHPSSGISALDTEAEFPIDISITDFSGREIMRRTMHRAAPLNIEGIPNGLYLLIASTNSGQIYSGKFVKQE